MQPHNIKVQSRIRQYLELPVEPQYALMLRGKWGSGKTWFIKREIEALEKQNKKILYVSLYGVSQTRQIESEFFRLMHPILGSKKMLLLASATKNVLKATLKFDVDGDGKEDGTLNISAPEIDFQSYLKDAAGFALVFDDIERCSIPVNDLLGYVNHFVEHGGHKVILVANEDEILRREKAETTAQYRVIKEKLVGPSLEIVPEADAALSSFVKDIGTDIKAHLEANRELIKSLHDASQYQNLRHLRQAVLELSSLLGLVNQTARDKPELVSDLICAYLVFHFEFRSGKLAIDDLRDFETSSIKALMREKGEDGEEPLATRLQAKYAPSFSPFETILPEDIWIELLGSGLVDPDRLNDCLINSRHFASETQEDWVRLWHGARLTDDQFAEVLSAVLRQLDEADFANASVLRHVVGMLLHYSEKGLLQESESAVLARGKAAVDEMKKRGVLGEVDSFASSHGYAGLGYMSVAKSEFLELDRYIADKAEELIEEKRPTQAAALLEAVTDEHVGDFMTQLVLSHKRSDFYRTPILHLISAPRFLEKYGELGFEARYTAVATFERRYDHPDSLEALAKEVPWLQELLALADGQKELRAGKVSSLKFELLAGACARALEPFGQKNAKPLASNS